MRNFVFLVLLVVFGWSSGASAVAIDWVHVSGAGNACDPQSQGCFGAVAEDYRIGKHEITNAQYVEFLNAVAETDTYELYNEQMTTSALAGIVRNGTSGNYSYGAIASREDMPVNYVSYYDAARFANWMQNGQVAGFQDSTTTESGAYELDGAETVGSRNPGASLFLPSEDEWYKAAYYAVALDSYFSYPAGSNLETACSTITPTSNSANCASAVSDLTAVGSYIGSPSPNGTFDQGGNVWEWTATIDSVGQYATRGGGLWGDASASTHLSSEYRHNDIYASLAYSSGHYGSIGFRLAGTVPEPTTALLLTLGFAGLGMRRRH